MGSLSSLPLAALAEAHGATWFCETGTAHGAGLSFALNVNRFNFCASIEVHEPTFLRASRRFAMDHRAHVYPGESPAVLAWLMERNPAPAVFWLDAHFPGVDVGAASFEETTDHARKFPAQDELNAISAAGRAGDVILLDDARIWLGPMDALIVAPVDLTQPFGTPASAGAPPWRCPIPLDLSAFAATHEARLIPVDQGYLILLPNEQPRAFTFRH